jgi:protein-tyrosine phosphatase
MSTEIPAMKHVAQFGLMSIAAAISAAVGPSHILMRAAMVWVAASFLLVAIAYAIRRPSLLMKRTDGSQPIHAWIVLGPYFVLSHFSLLLYRLSTSQSVSAAQVMPGVWFARRLTAREISSSPQHWSAVLDLAAEFPRIELNSAAYRSLPMLDGEVPSESQVNDANEWIDTHSQNGTVLIHCALGHGRTGTVVLTWLLRYQHARDATAGIALLKAQRDTFGMSDEQIAFVERIATTRASARSDSHTQPSDISSSSP